jgi:hypothetical protein
MKELRRISHGAALVSFDDYIECVLNTGKIDDLNVS